MSDLRYDAYQLFEHLRDTGTLQAIGEQIGEGIARKLADGNQAARRERIAAQAMAGLLSDPNASGDADKFAENALGFTDALIAALDGKPAVLAALAAVVPYAESRAEDMQETTETDGELHRPENQQLTDKAWAAVGAAKKLLRENGLVVP